MNNSVENTGWRQLSWEQTWKHTTVNGKLQERCMCLSIIELPYRIVCCVPLVFINWTNNFRRYSLYGTTCYIWHPNFYLWIITENGYHHDNSSHFVVRKVHRLSPAAVLYKHHICIQLYHLTIRVPNVWGITKKCWCKYTLSGFQKPIFTVNHNFVSPNYCPYTSL